MHAMENQAGLDIFHSFGGKNLNSFADVTRQRHQGLLNLSNKGFSPFNVGFPGNIPGSSAQVDFVKEDVIQENLLAKESLSNAKAGAKKSPLNFPELDQFHPPSPSRHHDDDDEEALVIDRGELESWFDQLQGRVLIGLCHGPRPSLETLEGWVAVNWENQNIILHHIMYLPSNYNLFFFEDSNSAFHVISKGQWLIKSTPLSFYRWYRRFDPRGDKPTCIPIWFDFPDMPVEFYPWLKRIGSKIGKVLGQKSRGGINPKWDPQLLIEINVSKPLKDEVPIKD
ncbi:hypothetical protein L7F22_037181 [Adiantum nelumboides]|nr:hypothetical protein [Adiantum nelumboides]